MIVQSMSSLRQRVNSHKEMQDDSIKVYAILYNAFSVHNFPEQRFPSRKTFFLSVLIKIGQQFI